MPPIHRLGGHTGFRALLYDRINRSTAARPARSRQRRADWGQTTTSAGHTQVRATEGKPTASRRASLNGERQIKRAAVPRGPREICSPRLKARIQGASDLRARVSRAQRYDNPTRHRITSLHVVDDRCKSSRVCHTCQTTHGMGSRFGGAGVTGRLPGGVCVQARQLGTDTFPPLKSGY